MEIKYCDLCGEKTGSNYQREQIIDYNRLESNEKKSTEEAGFSEEVYLELCSICDKQFNKELETLNNQIEKQKKLFNNKYLKQFKKIEKKLGNCRKWKITN